MGYSIGVRARSRKLQRDMVSFLTENYRKWSEVAGGHERHAVSGPTGDADYDGSKLFVGFNYSCSWGWDRLYTTTSCHWVALKVGRRRKSFSKDAVVPNVFPEPVPYITYDGYENWPVLVTTEKGAARLPKRQRWCATDKYGVTCSPDRWEDCYHHAMEECCFGDKVNGAKKAMSAMNKEMARTDWQALEDRGEITRRQWLDGIKAVGAKHMRPFMEKAFDEVREEMKRLDGLWEEEHGS